MGTLGDAPLRNAKLFWHVSVHVSGAENGAEQPRNRLERSGAVSGDQKIKWSVSRAGGRRNGNEAVSVQNMSRKIRSTTKPLEVKNSKSI